MITLEKLNKSIDETLFEPYSLPVCEYILMPDFSSLEFENFGICISKIVVKI